uniref:12D3 antigen n=1 Tax=Babesia gibsoni TaxID=33632 RepID=A8S446_BABGI|nr:12D3 antigen [Babesia gibsoni]
MAAPSGILSFIIAIAAPHIAHGFLYQAISMYEQGGKMICDPFVKVSSNANCVYHNNAAGYVCKENRSGNYVVNSYSQKCDIKYTICDRNSDEKYPKCALYSGCYTMNENVRACSCMPGFFGNPYKGCYKLCETDLDCPSPYAVCKAEGNEKVKRCKCKDGCSGDGIICTPPNKCKEYAKDTEEHRRCLQTDVAATEYVCDTGYYLDTNKHCVKAVTLKENMHVSVIANNFQDGQSINVGKCFSMKINLEKDGSRFYQLNSGDGVTVAEKLVTTPQLYVVYELRHHEVSAYGLLENDKTKLTKLFTVSNALNGCVIDGVGKFDEGGQAVTPSDVEVKTGDIQEGTEPRTEL